MAITYGMSVKEFWEDNPDLFWIYRFSYYNKIKEQQKIFNNNAWLQGAYFYEAVNVALNNSFSKDKIKYAEQPYGTKQKECDEKLETQKNDLLLAKLKGRIAQMQAIKGKNNSTTDKRETEGGEKINE